MTWLDSLTLASRSLRRRPGRALLTILAVTLGATLLVALASVAASAGSRIVSKLTNGGPATAVKVTASRADSDQLYTDDLLQLDLSYELVVNYRLPRVLIGALVGLCLSSAGTATLPRWNQQPSRFARRERFRPLQ